MDRDLLEEYGILPLAYDKGKLILGSYKAMSQVVRKSLEEILPFKINLYKIDQGLFEREVERCFHFPDPLVVYQKKRLILPPPEETIVEETPAEDLVRYIITSLIHKGERSFRLGPEPGDCAGGFRFFPFLHKKVESFLKGRGGGNPIPLLLEGKTLYLHTVREQGGTLQGELFPATLWSSADAFVEKAMESGLVLLLGRNTYRKNLFLSLFLQRRGRGGWLLSPAPLFRFDRFRTASFRNELFEKSFNVLLAKRASPIVVDSPPSLYYPFLWSGKEKGRFLLSLPQESEEDLEQRLREEKLQQALRGGVKAVPMVLTFQETEPGERFCSYRAEIGTVEGGLFKTPRLR